MRGSGERENRAGNQGPRLGEGGQKEVMTFRWFSNVRSQGFGMKCVENK